MPRSKTAPKAPGVQRGPACADQHVRPVISPHVLPASKVELTLGVHAATQNTVDSVAAEEEEASSILKKTKMCTFYLHSRCSRGSSCAFAHGEHELSSAPDLFRTKLCKTWLEEGKCNNAQCRFAHNRKEIRNLRSDDCASIPVPHVAFPQAVPLPQAGFDSIPEIVSLLQLSLDAHTTHQGGKSSATKRNKNMPAMDAINEGVPEASIPLLRNGFDNIPEIAALLQGMSVAQRTNIAPPMKAMPQVPLPVYPEANLPGGGCSRDNLPAFSGRGIIGGLRSMDNLPQSTGGLRSMDNLPQCKVGGCSIDNLPQFTGGLRNMNNLPQCQGGDRSTDNLPQFTGGLRGMDNLPQFPGGGRSTDNLPQFPGCGRSMDSLQCKAGGRSIDNLPQFTGGLRNMDNLPQCQGGERSTDNLPQFTGGLRGMDNLPQFPGGGLSTVNLPQFLGGGRSTNNAETGFGMDREKWIASPSMDSLPSQPLPGGDQGGLRSMDNLPPHMAPRFANSPLPGMENMPSCQNNPAMACPQPQFPPQARMPSTGLQSFPQAPYHDEMPTSCYKQPMHSDDIFYSGDVKPVRAKPGFDIRAKPAFDNRATPAFDVSQRENLIKEALYFPNQQPHSFGHPSAQQNLDAALGLLHPLPNLLGSLKNADLQQETHDIKSSIELAILLLSQSNLAGVAPDNKRQSCQTASDKVASKWQGIDSIDELCEMEHVDTDDSISGSAPFSRQVSGGNANFSRQCSGDSKQDDNWMIGFSQNPTTQAMANHGSKPLNEAYFFEKLMGSAPANRAGSDDGNDINDFASLPAFSRQVSSWGYVPTMTGPAERLGPLQCNESTESGGASSGPQRSESGGSHDADEQKTWADMFHPSKEELEAFMSNSLGSLPDIPFARQKSVESVGSIYEMSSELGIQCLVKNTFLDLNQFCAPSKPLRRTRSVSPSKKCESMKPDNMCELDMSDFPAFRLARHTTQ